MMDLVRQWLVGVTCAAMIVALADSLTPEGTVKKIGRLAGGLLLLAAVVKPLASVDMSVLAMSTVELEAPVAAAENLSQERMKTIIAEKTGAYILDKAEELGLSCQAAEVTCQVGEGDLPYPAAVTIRGDLSEEGRRTLARAIEADLAIPAECQTYESGEAER